MPLPWIRWGIAVAALGNDEEDHVIEVITLQKGGDGLGVIVGNLRRELRNPHHCIQILKEPT